ncbi:MAG: Gfo/Idh/MocA family oxidoreductase, partial [Opitutales bacterium]|nr:Gfo/Idh/MocA family oxidoreductase [Opitutales bacterium]
MSKKVNVGVVGLGRLGSLYTNYCANRLAKANLIAVSDVQEEVAKQVAEEYGAKRYYTDYQEMLADDEIEAIATFVLGLVAEPPAARYVYSPDQRTKDRNAGEVLLKKYNCVGCHVIDMPEMEFAVSDVSQFLPSEPDEKGHAEGLEALFRIRPPVQAYFGKSHSVVVDDEDPEILPVVRVRGLSTVRPDPDDPDDEEQMHALLAWEP